MRARASCALSLFVALAIAASHTWAQGDFEPLARRGFFGVVLGAAADGGGVVVTSVVPESTAADAGMLAGDVIRSVAGAPVTNAADVTTAIGRHRGGDGVDIEWLRDGAGRRASVTLRSFPTETLAGAAIDYGSVRTADGTRLRTIVSVPESRSGRLPAALLIQGGGCGSIDTPFATATGQAGLMHAIGRLGFVAYRVEKSGVGDSDGPSCADIGYYQELAGYRAALADLFSHPAVDPQRIFLVGVSLGGVFAPILAGETPVAGIVTYGTIDFAPMPYAGRSDRFFAEFEDVDVLGAWRGVDVPTLILHGEFDPTPAAASPAITAAVNALHPGRAAYRELAGLDHCWTRHATLEASLNRCGQGEIVASLADAVLAFLREHS